MKYSTCEIIKLSLLVFKKESELHLAYFHGEAIYKNDYYIKKPIKRNGVFWRFLVLMRNVCLRTTVNHGKNTESEVIGVVTSKNQFLSMVTTLSELKKKGVGCNLLSLDDPEKSSYLDCYDGLKGRIEFSSKIVFIAAVLFFCRGPRLITKLKKDGHPGLEKYLDIYLEAYFYTPYFLNLFAKCQPKIVLLSNDHNLVNRCALAAASKLGIKTGYMQHASVSGFFPPLDFDYAFLDGEIAKHIYLTCEKNRVITQEKSIKVFYSGQKKKLIFSRKEESKKIKICLAVSIGDELALIKRFCLLLIDKKFIEINIRSHPGHDRIFKKELDCLALKYENLFHVNSKKESLISIFSRINILFSANSSIHLESLLSNIPSYYVGLGGEYDYYGYIKNGALYESPKDIGNYSLEQFKVLEKITSDQIISIKKYSSTFMTHWQNREGELVSQTIIKLISNEDISFFYKVTEKKESYKVYETH